MNVMSKWFDDVMNVMSKWSDDVMNGMSKQFHGITEYGLKKV
jgi:hypothetical protein